MSRGSFFIALLVIIAVVGFVFTYTTGMLPRPVYLATAGIAQYFTPKPVPYLEKFEGVWSVAFQPASAQSELALCQHPSGQVSAHNGVFTGTLYGSNRNFSFKASTTQNGILSGTLTQGLEYSGTFSGSVSGASGSGSWHDTFECTGTVTFTKLAPVVDPVAGKIVSVDGVVTLSRGGESQAVFPGEMLYAGDVLRTGQSSEAFLSIGFSFTPMTVPAQSTYTVGAER